MSGATTSHLAARFLLPDYLTRAEDNVVSCPVYQDGALVAPTSGTFSLTNGSGEVVHSGAVTVSGDIAQITVPASDLPTSLSFSTGWRCTWALVIGGTTRRFGNHAHLVRSRLYPVLTDADLYRRVRSLDPNGPAPIASLQTYQDYRDEAWVQLLAEIAGEGPLPYLIMEPSALREVHMLATLRMIFEDFATREDDRFEVRAADYADRYARAFKRLTFRYDSNQDGRTESSRRRPATSTIWFG